MKKKDDKISGIEKNLIDPIVSKFQKKDVIQVIVGATILAIPISLTEEAWILGETLPNINIISIFLLSLIFISVFIYYQYHHKRNIEYSELEFFKRVFSTYILTFFITSILLILIGKAPWTLDWVLALKRTVIISLPASMSAVIADSIK